MKTAQPPSARCRWLRQREIRPDGAILVRPDRFVGWRSLGHSAAPAAELEAAFEAILSLGTRASAS